MSNYKLFIDESGTSSLKNVDPIFPVIVLTGLFISDSDYVILQQQVEKLKEKYFPGKDVVLHRRDMRKYERGFEIFFDDDIKRRFYVDLNSILTNSNFTLISAGIDKEKHIKQYGKLADDPYEIALTFVLERALYEAQTRNILKITTAIESRGKREDSVVARRYNEILFRGSGRVAAIDFQRLFHHELYRRRKDDGEIGIEIADLCAYPIARYVLNNNEPNPAFDVIKAKIRSNNKGQFEGYGIKIFPS